MKRHLPRKLVRFSAQRFYWVQITRGTLCLACLKISDSQNEKKVVRMSHAVHINCLGTAIHPYLFWEWWEPPPNQNSQLSAEFHPLSMLSWKQMFQNCCNFFCTYSFTLKIQITKAVRAGIMYTKFCFVQVQN